jgi:hypothetical protein
MVRSAILNIGPATREHGDLEADELRRSVARPPPAFSDAQEADAPRWSRC